MARSDQDTDSRNKRANTNEKGLHATDKYFWGSFKNGQVNKQSIKTTKLPDPDSMDRRCPRTSFGMTQVINYHLKNNIPKCANFSHIRSRLIENVYFS
jgi:hypothetical protein